ncbi:Phthiotriol/phenolphthiotriol dimycocerosates methyltransferase [Aphelenchoides bicaudatus]|nr:Phthiotriol/phenolphthiotriol dimycocerosates methyltransferase [Aphelenchoides bicaudatus]
MKIPRLLLTVIKMLVNLLLKILSLLQQLHFYLFDQFILYPLMRKIAKTYQIEFLNLGYAPELGAFTSLETETSVKYHYYLYEKALSLCPPYEKLDKTNLLDVGCGIGNSIKWIKQAHPEINKVIGVDKCIQSKKNSNLIEGDAEKLPFQDSEFDIVLNVESSHLYSNPQRFFNEAFRVLKSNGHLCWTDLRPSDQANTPFKEAKNAGFHLVNSECINEQVLNGINFTSAHYDQKLSTTPWFIRMFSRTFRTTYCAPGTPTYQKIQSGQTVYQVACWRKL